MSFASRFRFDTEELVNTFFRAIKAKNIEQIKTIGVELNGQFVNLRNSSSQNPLEVALTTNDYDIIKNTFELVETDNWRSIYESLLPAAKNGGAIATKMLVHSICNNGPFSITEDCLNITEDEWIRKLESLRTRKIKRVRDLFAKVVRAMHSAKVLSMENIAQFPTTLTVFLFTPQFNTCEKFKSALVNGKTLLTSVITSEKVPYTTKLNFVRFCHEKFNSNILNDDLHELIECLKRAYGSLFKLLVKKSPCPSLDREIHEKNLCFYLAKYMPNSNLLTLSCFSPFSKSWLTAKDHDRYLLDIFLCNSPRLARYPAFWEALQEIIDQKQAHELLFYKKKRIARNRLAQMLLHQSGIEHENFRLIAKSSTKASEIDHRQYLGSAIFPIYDLPLELFYMLARYLPIPAQLAIFCLSKECHSIKGQHTDNVFWSEYFQQYKPIKHKQLNDVVQGRPFSWFYCAKEDSSLAVNWKTGKYVKSTLDFTSLVYCDDNWLMFTGQPKQVITLWNSWTQQRLNFYARFRGSNNFFALESSPYELPKVAEISMGFRNNIMVTHMGEDVLTEVELPRSNSVKFLAYHDRKLFYERECTVLDITTQKKITTILTPGNNERAEYASVNPLNGHLGLIISTDSAPHIKLYDSSYNFMMTISNDEPVTNMKFLDEHMLVIGYLKGLRYIDMRMITDKIEIGDEGRVQYIDAANYRAICGKQYSAVSVWNLKSRTWDHVYSTNGWPLISNARYLVSHSLFRQGIEMFDFANLGFADDEPD